MTYEGVAAAFGTTCVLHEPTLLAMTAALEKKGTKMTPERERMAMFPKGTLRSGRRG